ncbi:MAG: hypothetical protein COB02_02590 [Candidatus Cloacimonadota bacterium]|nr:MAG: hypothetical protein COB02_02590 [Candidatus Cloacimonadota bacterium]
MIIKKCFCKKSKKFPICDGEHGQLGWSCNIDIEIDPDYAFFSNLSLENIGLKAANHFDGVSYVNPRKKVICQKAVYFSNGTDLEHFEKWKNKIDAQKYYIIFLNKSILRPKISLDWEVILLDSDCEHPMLELERFFSLGLVVNSLTTILDKVFLSHSVQDENSIHFVVEYLRKFLDVDIFLCGDSLQEGSLWFDEIESNLKGREHFILLNSAFVKSSVFCAFEAGMAKAFNKKISIISLDGSTPSAYFQHLHMFDIPRLQLQKPWLTHKEVLIETFFKILG